jgi:hypothetical protein
MNAGSFNILKFWTTVRLYSTIPLITFNYSNRFYYQNHKSVRLF